MRTQLQGHHWQESTHIGHFQASEAVIVEPGFPAKYLSAKSKNRSTTVPSLLSRHQFQLALNEYIYCDAMCMAKARTLVDWRLCGGLTK